MMITFLSIQCLLPILYKHANIINSFHYIIGIYGQPPYNFLCVNMEIYRSRRKLFSSKPCVTSSPCIPVIPRTVQLQSRLWISYIRVRCWSARFERDAAVNDLDEMSSDAPAVGEWPPYFNMEAESLEQLHFAAICDCAVCQLFSVCR